MYKARELIVTLVFYSKGRRCSLYRLCYKLSCLRGFEDAKGYPIRWNRGLSHSISICNPSIRARQNGGYISTI